MDQDDSWYGGRPQPRRLCVGWDTAPSPKRGGTPQVSAHVYCGQTATRIKMPLGTEVGLGPHDIVLDGDPAPLSKKGRTPSPIFGPRLLWPNGWMDQDGTWHGGGHGGSGRIVLDGDPAPLPKKGAEPPPQFSAHFSGQTAGCIKMPLGMEVGLIPGDFVLDGGPAPSQKGRSLQFSAHVYCGQTAAWVYLVRRSASAYATLC